MRPSVRAASSQRHTVRTFTPPTWAPARTCAVVNVPAASSSSNRATSTGLDTLNPAVTSPHAPGSPTPHPSARAKPTPTTVPPRNPRKDQKCRSQDSGAERGVPPHDSHDGTKSRPMSVTPHAQDPTSSENTLT